MPALNLDIIASTRCLLLGSGTLGCYVARTLMVRSARHYTALDLQKYQSRVGVCEPSHLLTLVVFHSRILFANRFLSLKTVSTAANLRQSAQLAI